MGGWPSISWIDRGGIWVGSVDWRSPSQRVGKIPAGCITLGGREIGFMLVGTVGVTDPVRHTSRGLPLIRAVYSRLNKNMGSARLQTLRNTVECAGGGSGGASLYRKNKVHAWALQDRSACRVSAGSGCWTVSCIDTISWTECTTFALLGQQPGRCGQSADSGAELPHFQPGRLRMSGRGYRL